MILQVDVLIVIVISQKKKRFFLLNIRQFPKKVDGPVAEWGFHLSSVGCLDALGKDLATIPRHGAQSDNSQQTSIHLPPRDHACQGTTTSIKVSGSHINLTSKKTVTFQIWSWYPKQPFFQGCVLNWMMKQIFKMGSWMMNHISTGERRISEPSTVINTAWFSPQNRMPSSPPVVGWVNWWFLDLCWLVPRRRLYAWKWEAAWPEFNLETVFDSNLELCRELLMLWPPALAVTFKGNWWVWSHRHAKTCNNVIYICINCYNMYIYIYVHRFLQYLASADILVKLTRNNNQEGSRWLLCHTRNKGVSVTTPPILLRLMSGTW